MPASDSDSPRVTIGLPVYNGLDYLDEAVASVLAQTFTDFELLLADNASTDGTTERCREWAARDLRVRHLGSDVNRGASWNWNRLVDAARGRYFRWLSHDDAFEPRLLEASVAVLDHADDDVVGCYTSTLEIDAAGAPIGVAANALALDREHPHERLREPLRNLGPRHALFSMVRTDVLRATCRLGPYPRADETLIADLALRGKVLLVPEPLFRRRMHEQQSLHTHPTAAQLQRFYDPSRRQRYFFPSSRMLAEHVAAIRRAPISAPEKTRCLGVLLKEWQWYRAMAGETRIAVLNTPVGRRLATQPVPEAPRVR